MVLGLGEGAAPLGRQAGADGGRQRPRQVVGGVPVPGQRRGQRRVGAGEAGARPAERGGQAGVQAAPLAGQERVVDRLLDQRVPESWPSVLT